MGHKEFGLVVQDNGRGIPMELDGKLDRGHGMASMKHRAKQMQGQCLVESGPGYGTVIRLTLPLGTALHAAHVARACYDRFAVARPSANPRPFRHEQHPVARRPA